MRVFLTWDFGLPGPHDVLAGRTSLLRAGNIRPARIAGTFGSSRNLLRTMLHLSGPDPGDLNRAKGLIMGRSFFGRTDADLRFGSVAFANQISDSPESFGLSPSDAAAYQSLSDIYIASYEVANAPGTRTKGTVIAKNDARAALRAMASTLARKINGTATVTDAQKIGLGLSVPGAPTAVAELGKPDQCSFALEVSGALRLKWKCVNARATGTVYLVSRQIESIAGERVTGADREMKFLGISRKRRFVDLTLPAGTSQMVYQIQAVRSTAVGEAATFNVTFGVRAGQSLPRQMVDATQKLAA